jgi:hypothetical protein
MELKEEVMKKNVKAAVDSRSGSLPQDIRSATGVLD